jgi:phage-related protein
MPITLPQTFKDEIERPQQSNAMLWLLDLVVSRGDVLVPPVILRIYNGQSTLTWPLGTADTTTGRLPAGARTWYPFPFAHSGFEQNQEGDLPQVELTIDNTSRFLMQYLHDGDGLEGNAATLFLVPSNSLGLTYPNHEFRHWELEVAGVIANEEAIGIRLERPNFLQRTSPGDRYIPSRCRWQFGGPQCGYVINGFAAFTRCPKTIAACIARGADMEERGLPEILPGNFGGHPGVSTQR